MKRALRRCQGFIPDILCKCIKAEYFIYNNLLSTFLMKLPIHACGYGIDKKYLIIIYSLGLEYILQALCLFIICILCVGKWHICIQVYIGEERINREKIISSISGLS